MRTTKTLSAKGSVLSTMGWLALVLALIGGLLGMHVMGGVHALEPAPGAGAAATTTPAMHTATPNHQGFSSALSDGQPVADTLAPAHPGDPMGCGSSPAEGHTSVDGHGTCILSLGSVFLSLPPQGALAPVHTGTAFTSAPGPKSRGRIPDSPSPMQLSIIRT